MIAHTFTYGTTYDRLTRVQEYTARRHGVDLRVHRLPACRNRSDAFKRKARDWAQCIAEATEPIALLDADTYFRASLGPPWRGEDVLITTHGKAFNSGVVFVRPSPKVTAFFSQWGEATDKWCKRNTATSIRYGDQDALRVMLHNATDIVIGERPMVWWNSTQLTWEWLDIARIVHVKSDARDMIYNPEATQRHMHASDVVNEFLSIERAMQ